uniref:Uncharacterized protein n=1 Tax=Acrobeloides nanus TaxID=290746 RepID=A0A914DQ96_9BILA
MPYGNSSIICGPEPQFYDPQPIVTGCISSGCCPPQGVWSQWSSSTSCNGTCGGCGVQTKSRICMTEANGCPCIGPTTMSAPCAFGPCIYPNNSCCAPFSAMVDSNKNVVCGPQNMP